jgi:hypothetical protein
MGYFGENRKLVNRVHVQMRIPLRLKIHLPCDDDDSWRLSHDAGRLVRKR